MTPHSFLHFFLTLFFLFDSIHRTQPQPTACQAMKDNRCCWTRGKVIGGSSVLNTMLYVRGNRRDYDQWEALGNPGWGFDDVLPYFKKSEDQRNPYLARNSDYHGVGKCRLRTADSEFHSNEMTIMFSTCRRTAYRSGFTVQYAVGHGIFAGGRGTWLRYR